MSQRGRGSGTRDDDPEDESGARGAAPSGRPTPSLSTRPIAPYDPYRSQSGSSRATRNVAGSASPPGRVSEGHDDDVLPEEPDPLRSEAWQLELDADVEEGEMGPASSRPTQSPTRRSRRSTSTVRAREQSATAERSSRRSRSRATQANTLTQRPSISLAV